VQILNKTMDRADLDEPAARDVCRSLDELVRWLDERSLVASSWYGGLPYPEHLAAYERVNRGYGYEPLPGAADDARFPWFLYWEIAWVARRLGLRPGQRLLDLGGSSSLFSFWAAWRGLDVLTVDLDERLVANADEVAAATGWKLRNRVADMRSLDVRERFDHVTSICVFEHVPLADRVDVTRAIRELLLPGGTFALTFDYANPSRRARIGSPEDVHEQFVAPSGLEPRGNPRFLDNGLRYLLHPFHHPRAREEGWIDLCLSQGQFDPAEAGVVRHENEYTFGALFLGRS
jgi:2-polyprenyl-3-methyl-5-hydroxy-6-metoxy-1,4-benzoquinol methylase